MNWKRNSLNVLSPKTAAHEGHAVRIVPIEGVLLSILQELLDASPLGVDAMIPMLRDSTVNLRTQLSKIVARTGLKPRPRMFQIRRASCECDWVERHPNYEVASWMGHSTLSQAAAPQPRVIDPELATVVAVWSTLPPALRCCVLELIAAGSDGYWRKS